jgi:hypothetical protein
MYSGPVSEGPRPLIRLKCATEGCSKRVIIGVEGTDKDIGVLCPEHKDKPTFLAIDKRNLERKIESLKTSFNLKTISVSIKLEE